jgi:hypothetical protein
MAQLVKLVKFDNSPTGGSESEIWINPLTVTYIEIHR